VTQQPTIRLFLDGRKPGECRASECRALLDWYETLTGKSMPMNRGAQMLRETVDDATGRRVGFFASEDAHWNSCPAAPKFAARRRTKARDDDHARD
jgi:hypothetical protein